jgi:formate dehydrogenase major subunit
MAASVPVPATEAGSGPRAALSRRDFIKLSGGVSAALGTLGALGVSLAPTVAHARALRIQNARSVPTICPYCAVGCGMIAHTINNRIVNIEGNPDSPVSEGNLCPKGAASYQLAVNELRWTTVKYRAPNSAVWEDRTLDWAMERIAQLTKQTRDATFQEKTSDGKTLMNTTALFSLGGATIDNEWNYSHSKLMRGLGIVAVENQARI